MVPSLIKDNWKHAVPLKIILFCKVLLGLFRIFSLRYKSKIFQLKLIGEIFFPSQQQLREIVNFNWIYFKKFFCNTWKKNWAKSEDFMPTRHLLKWYVSAGSAITNGREPRSCLGRVLNSKLGCFATPDSKCMVCMQPLLKLKIQPKACPVS